MKKLATSITTILCMLTTTSAFAQSFDLSSTMSKRYEKNCAHKDTFDSMALLTKYTLSKSTNERVAYSPTIYKLRNVVYKNIPVHALSFQKGRTKQLTQSIVFDRNNAHVQKHFKNLHFREYESDVWRPNYRGEVYIEKTQSTITVSCSWLPQGK